MRFMMLLFAVCAQFTKTAEALPSRVCTAHKPWQHWKDGTTWQDPASRWHNDYLYHLKDAIVGNGRLDPNATAGRCPFGHPSDCPFIMICGTIRNKSTTADDFANFLTGGIYVMIVLHFCWVLAFQLNPRSVALVASFIFNNIIYTLGLHANINSPRPVQSCTIGCGMPSGHVSNAYILLAWDAYWFFILSRKPCSSKPAGVFFGEGPLFEVVRVVVFAVCCVMLGPMPWASWDLGDHSTAQCFAGAFLGLSTFMVWNGVFWRVIVRPPARDWHAWQVFQVLFMCRTVQGVTGWCEFIKDISGWAYKPEIPLHDEAAIQPAPPSLCLGLENKTGFDASEST